MELKTIGVIHSPYQTPQDAPKMGRESDQEFTIEIFEDFAEGIRDIQPGDAIDILHWGHLSNRDNFTAKPPHLDHEVGVFSSRSPHRPNPILINSVEVIRLTDTGFVVSGLDAVDGSPLIDVKSTLRQA